MEVHLQVCTHHEKYGITNECIVQLASYNYMLDSS